MAFLSAWGFSVSFSSLLFSLLLFYSKMCFLICFPFFEALVILLAPQRKRKDRNKNRAAERKCTMRRERNYHRTEVTLMEKIKNTK